MEIGLDYYLRLATDALFIVVGVRGFVQYWRFRDVEHLYFALFCFALTVSTVVSELAQTDGTITVLEGKIISVALAFQPFLLLRIAGTIEDLPRGWTLFAAVGLGYSLIVIAFMQWGDGGYHWSYAGNTVYFIAVLIYAASRFWRAARAKQGVTRNRYFFTFAGSVLLAVAVLLLTILTFVPFSYRFLESAFTLVTAFSAAAYFVGFLPPGFIRRAWQAAMVNQYQSRIIRKLINKPAESILRFLARSSLQAVGGRHAILISYDRADRRLSLDSLSETLSFTIPIEELDGFGSLLGSFDPTPRYYRRRDIPENTITACLLGGFGAGAIFSVPVINLPHALTLLVVTLRSGTLFADEDLSILRRYADQARAILQNNSLIATTKGVIEELRDETSDLEEMVVEREAALRASEDELRRRLVQMSLLYRELEAFSYSVSHDLRAPLRAITGFSGALAEDYGTVLPPEALDYVQRISANSHKMDDLMNDMLKLSKLSRSEMSFTQVDLTDIAVRVGHELRSLNPAHDVAFTVQSGLIARADPALAKVLLTNLLDNAWKFTQRTRNPTVTLSASPMNGETVYQIVDNGAGFSMAYADKLFKPFQRLHSSDEFEGNGIGLTVVQRIVHRHGGRVWAESQPGQGARFYFTLPGRMTSAL